MTPDESGSPEIGTAGVVEAVNRSARHDFSKGTVAVIRLVAGLGVDADAHQGSTDQHRSHVARDPTTANRRQVHLIQAELFDELRGRGFEIRAGDIGENVTTRGVALLELPTGARLRVGRSAVVELTGLRNPCQQLDRFAAGLMQAVLERDAAGNLVRKSGVMAIVVEGGEVRGGDPIRIELPLPPYRPLVPV